MLLQDNIPKYAIQPRGAFSEESYVELAKFLMEQAGFDSDTLGDDLRNTSELDVDFTKPLVARERRTEFVAIPGVLGPDVHLLTGHVVPVIYPDMAGTSELNVEALAKSVEGKLPLKDEDERELVRRILDRFTVEIRNPGISPEDRAKNYGATQVFPILLEVFATVKKRYGLDQVEIDEILVRKSETALTSSFDLYDFNLSLFDPSNIHRARVVVSVTIDVADVVPSNVGAARIYSGR